MKGRLQKIELSLRKLLRSKSQYPQRCEEKDREMRERAISTGERPQPLMAVVASGTSRASIPETTDGAPKQRSQVWGMKERGPHPPESVSVKLTQHRTQGMEGARSLPR